MCLLVAFNAAKWAVIAPEHPYLPPTVHQAGGEGQMKWERVMWKVLLRSAQASYLLFPCKKENGSCVLVVALCGSHHRTPLGGMVEPLQMPLVLVASVRGLSGLSQRPGEGFVGVLSKCCHLQENNGSVGGLSQDGKQGKWVFICRDQKGRWMGGVGTVPLSHVARRLHCSTSTCGGSVLSKPGGTERWDGSGT